MLKSQPSLIETLVTCFGKIEGYVKEHYRYTEQQEPRMRFDLLETLKRELMKALHAELEKQIEVQNNLRNDK